MRDRGTNMSIYLLGKNHAKQGQAFFASWLEILNTNTLRTRKLYTPNLQS